MKSINYPVKFDTDENLYLVADALQVPLGFDYYPGNQNIVADGDISRFPSSGIITLVDQCSNPKERAASFYYTHRTNREFWGLQLLPDSINCFKPRKITKITMQAMADHREALKDAIIAIEKFLGAKHQTDDSPKGDTIFGRLNFLKKILFSPKAWFEIENTMGVAPFTTKFTFAGTGNIGPVGDVTYIWKFNEEEITTNQPSVEKTFLTAASYTVSLTIKNYYGEDTVTFPDVIKVKSQAPEQALITFVPAKNQLLFGNKIRTPVNQPINVELQKPERRTLSNDIVTNYTWNIGDDLPHSNATKTKVLYSVGGKFDLNIRQDTKSGSYRTSTYEDCIDVVDPLNAWIWTRSGNTIRSLEFGLLSEVLKTSNNTYNIVANDSFVSGKDKFEFWRNNGTAKQTQLNSGDGGTCLLFWASGRSPEDNPSAEEIKLLSYNGFTDTYESLKGLRKPWNWAAFASENNVYFTSKDESSIVKSVYNIGTGSTTVEKLHHRNLKGAQDMVVSGSGTYYRTAWKGSVGYLLRGETSNNYFSFRNFYKTDGTIGKPYMNLVKLPDMPGDANKEGSLVVLNQGIYFFNNFGETCCYNDMSGSWELVHAHNKVAREELDSLLAASDCDSSAIISIENTAFFKFNEIDMSYVNFNHGPITSQWLMTVF